MKTIHNNPTQLKSSFLTLLSIFFFLSISSSVFSKGYQPNSFSISGGATVCQFTPVTLTATVGSFKCANGGGTINSTGTIQWFSNVINSNVGGTAVGGAQPFTTNVVTATTYTYDPDVSTVGTLYYYYVVTWDDNGEGGTCGTGTGTSATQTVVVTPGATQANAGGDQSPGDCSTSTTLAGNTITSGSGVWTVSPAGPTITSPTSPTSGVTGMTAGSEYTFTWTATNGGCSNSSDMVFNSVGPGCAVVCPSSYTNTVDEWFTNVTFDGNSYTTGSSNYDNSNIGSCMTVTQGSSYTLSATWFAASATFIEEAYAFFDWNGDGDFDDLDEAQVLGNSTGSGSGTIDISIPCSGVIGSVTMRIMLWAQVGGPPTGCTSGTFGETEDYCLNITASGVPLAVTASNLPPCSSSATLDATGSSATGFWSIVSGSGTIANINDPTTTIDGLANGTTVVQWTSIEACDTDVSQETIVVSGFPNDAVYAGADQSQCSITSTVLEGSSPSPYTGAWTVSPAGPTFDDATDPAATISGLVTGNTYTLTWSVTTSSCGVVTDDMLIIVGSTPPPADAGSALAGCPESINMAAVLPAGFAGIWTQNGGPATATISDINDPNALMYGMTATGTYTYTWTISGGGCTGSTFADVDVVISNCQTPAPIGGTYTGCNFLFTDDGGAAGNYSDGMSQASTTTVFCADDPADFVSMEFTAFDLAPGDYMLIHDSPSPGSFIVGYGTSAGIYLDPNGTPSSTQTMVSYTGCFYITFFSNSTVNDPGWEANVTCTSTGGAENSSFFSGDNCGGGGGITVCESGNYPTVNSNAGSPQEIGNGFGPGTTCIADGEGNSQWVYFNIETSGFIEFEINPAGGQDFDFQIWGPYNGGISCPGFTGEAPIRCTWAINANNACPGNLGQAEIGLAYESPVASPSTVLPSDVNENLGSCVDGPGAEDGWLYPIDAVAGEVYVMLVQNFAQNAANWTFTYDGTTPGIAGLGCTAPTPLPLSLLSFNGENVERKNNLYWTTASERNSNYFTIEKSKDGINWEVLSIIAAAGNSDEFLMYEEVDNTPFKDLTYYRLLQTDLEGKSEIAKTIAIRSELAEENFTDIYPNPSDKNFYFNYGGNDFYTTINVEIVNSLGQIVLMQDYSEFNKSTALSIDAGELSEGFYQVKITQGSRFEIQKISVIK
jgi:hypothetical protein